MKILIFLLFLSILPTAHGDEGLKKLYGMSLEELMQLKITGSTLTEESLKTVPSSVTVFSHIEIQGMGLDTLDELMNLVPGFQSYRSSFSSLHYPFSSRGRRIGFPSAEILILIDGQRMSEARNSGSAVILPKFPLAQIAKVEFIRGPGAAIYGSNAMMGVVNITTKTNIEDKLTLALGSFERKQLQLETSSQIGHVNLDFFGQLDADNGDEYQLQDSFSSATINTDDAREVASFNLKLHWQNSHLYLQHNQFESQNFYELDNTSDGFNQREGALSSIYFKQDFSWLAVKSYLSLSYSQSKFFSAAQFAAAGSLADISNPSSNDALLTKTHFNNNNESRLLWHNNWSITPLSSWQWGVEFRYIDSPEAVTSSNFNLGDLASGNIPIRSYDQLIPNTVVLSESGRNIIGVYSQFQQTLFEKNHLTLGLRFDDFSGIGSQVSPRLGLVHEINAKHSLKLLYGEAFRSPTEGELNFLNSTVVLGNKNLKAESVKSAELIWVAQWDQSYLSLGYFSNDFKNAIAQTETDADIFQFNNIEQSPSKGFEFEFSQQLAEHWLLRGSYTYITEKPELSFRESDQLASFMVNFQYEQWNVNVIASYASGRELPAMDDSEEHLKLDDYWQLFGKTIYHFDTQWQAFVQVKNLLNENYLTPTTNLNLMQGVDNRGRELLLGASWKF